MSSFGLSLKNKGVISLGKFILPEKTKIVTALAPAADAAGRAAEYVTLKDAPRCYVLVSITQGNAAPVELTIEQAQDVAGTGAKPIDNVVPIWANLDESVSDNLVRQTDAVNFTTDAGLKNKMVLLQIDAASLDTNNGFNCISVATGASDVTNITTATYILTDIRYQQANPPSAIVD